MWPSSLSPVFFCTLKTIFQKGCYGFCWYLDSTPARKPCGGQLWLVASIFSKVFFGSLPLKILMHLLHCVTDQPITIPSRGSFLDYKFSLLTHAFLRLMTGWMSIHWKLCKETLFQFQSMSNAITCVEQQFSVKNLLWSLCNLPVMLTPLTHHYLKQLFCLVFTVFHSVFNGYEREKALDHMGRAVLCIWKIR